MKKSVYKIATFCVVGTLSMAIHMKVAKAEEIPVAGIDVILDQYYDSHDEDEYQIDEYLNPEKARFENLAIAQVSNYVNIRKKADEDSKILGKLYNNSAATIIEEQGQWLKIQSGSVTGYIKSEYVVYGENVESLAKKVGKSYATVNTTTLKVREKASQDSIVLTLIPEGEEYSVKKESKGWVKIAIDSDIIGYVSKDYVDIKTTYKQAESIEEEKARLEKEAKKAAEKAREAQEEAARAAASSQAVSSQSSSGESGSSNRSSNDTSTDVSISNNTSTNTSSRSNSDLRNAIVQYALRFEGNPYVWGGTSLTNGADCSGFTQSVFRDNGISIPRTSRQQAGSGRAISISQIQPGDLIFYDRNGTINHVAIYIGNGKVISASSPETGIRITSYNYREPYKAVNYID